MIIPKQEKRFDYKGFPCVILFMPTAYRCGYVGVPLPQGLDIKTDKISCHGGVTYYEGHLHRQDDVDKWWVGYDCGHYGDGFDVETAKKLYADDEKAIKQLEIMKDYFEIQSDFPIHTLEYCEEQCKLIVEQLIEMGIKSTDTD